MRRSGSISYPPLDPDGVRRSAWPGLRQGHNHRTDVPSESSPRSASRVAAGRDLWRMWITLVFTAAIALVPIATLADPYINLDDAPLLALPSWSACGGPAGPSPLRIDVPVLLPIVVCVGKTDEEAAVRDLMGIERAMQPVLSMLPARARIELALMQIFGSHQEYSKAMATGKFGIFLAKEWSTAEAFRIEDEEQRLLWDILSLDMRNVLLAHGGLRTSNSDALPQDWKSDGAITLWSYKTGGAIVTTYIFTDGKLTQTLKP